MSPAHNSLSFSVTHALERMLLFTAGGRHRVAVLLSAEAHSRVKRVRNREARAPSIPGRARRPLLPWACQLAEGEHQEMLQVCGAC